MSLINLPKCCLDMDINLVDIAFPELLSAEGKEFVDVHGLKEETVSRLFSNAINLGNGKVKILHRCSQLLDNGKCAIYEHRPKICRDFDCNSRSDCACKGEGKI